MPSNTTKLVSAVYDWEKMQPMVVSNGVRRTLFEGPTATLDKINCHITTLNPGEMPHAGHQHPAEELIIVKEGTIEAVQNSVTNRVGPGSIIFEASNEYHSLRNVGQTQATYYVIKWVSPGMSTEKK